MIALAIGAVVGLVLGLTGAGGSLLAVPLLVLGLSLAPAEATGLALGVVAVSSAWGLLGRLRNRQVVYLPALVLGVTGVLFAPAGRWLANQVPDTVLLYGFALLVLVVATRMWRQSQRAPGEAMVTRAQSSTQALTEREQAMCRFSPSGNLELKPRCVSSMVAGGVFAGLLSGLFGVGGGFVIVPLLTLLTGLSMSAAVATSLAVIAPVSLAGFGSFLWLGGDVPMDLLGWLAAGGILGMLVGSQLAGRLAGPVLQKVFVVVMVSLTLVTLVKV
ncbi:sulfite exporter TauE/SafE family protein [Simiduia agarivorans]|uniref:Probable membrane transporter protein n=1 Tax=Simiduia agarivorans (strain DSM 21679 / JCM 13881 / BCRC 17597 / SA1) TaxID=1117647 RepID=K4KRP1_SIMAS|nr:sulfite exporter TauE/SafE family protein [Simiduia agarivorans]AFV00819.1 hypothetical protein M5M_18450 [Simiduia agarivorans SA1 = DSM 21679]